MARNPAAENKYWDDIWAKGVRPGERWDVGKTEPDFAYELSLADKGLLGPVFTAMKTRPVRALVPGCGHGYSVKDLAERGFHAVGADISPSAVEAAKVANPHPQASFVCNDFFKDDFGKFDLVYDSTFLCAIPPVMWRAWGKRMGEVVAPNGYIAMHVFPVAADANAPELAIDGSDNEPGPPHRVTLNLIRSLLIPNGFEEVGLRATPKERVARGGRVVHGQQMVEYFMVWRKKSTERSDL